MGKLPVDELRAVALDAGMVTMRETALERVVNGIIPRNELPWILPAERMAPERSDGKAIVPLDSRL